MTTYVDFPPGGLVCFNADDRINSSRCEDALESMALFEASRADRISRLSLELAETMGMRKRDLHVLGKVRFEAINYTAEVSSITLVALDIDRFI